MVHAAIPSRRMTAPSSRQPKIRRDVMKPVSFLRASFAAAIVAATVAVAAVPALAEVVLRRGNGAEPQTLDAAHTSIDIERNVLKDLFEGLTVYDAAGAIKPGAAESWTSNADGTVYTFKIRAN